MRIHILGIAGTFMAGVAKLAQELGHDVSGSDKNIFPPMNKQIDKLGISILDSTKEKRPPKGIDLVIIGNTLTRGNPIIEYILEHKLNYCSGPDWISKNILQDKKNIVVTGTHGKTTIASLIAWILNDNGIDAGFLIGGVPNNFGCSARIGESQFFIIEGDEYDTAFFDKRSKFIHYKPETLIINNIEYDHADIFSSLQDIVKQFHHLLRTMPKTATIITPEGDKTVSSLIDLGCWSTVKTFGQSENCHMQYQYDTSKQSFKILSENRKLTNVNTPLMGKHNAANVAAAVLACQTSGLNLTQIFKSLTKFTNVSRRLELIKVAGDIKIYSDFAHHPTAIAKTIDALKEGMSEESKLLVIIEPKSNTMKSGVHEKSLEDALANADKFLMYDKASLEWVSNFAKTSGKFLGSFRTRTKAARTIAAHVDEQDTILIMSNGQIDKLIKCIFAHIKQKEEQL